MTASNAARFASIVPIIMAATFIVACERQTDVFVENRYDGVITVTANDRGGEFAPGEMDELFVGLNTKVDELRVVTATGEEFSLKFPDDANRHLRILVEGPPLRVTIDWD